MHRVQELQVDKTYSLQNNGVHVNSTVHLREKSI